MSYAEQLRTVQSLPVATGTSRRFDCPFCSGRGTLSVTDSGYELQWHCFKAGCRTKGKHTGMRDTLSIQKALQARVKDEGITPFEPPAHWTSPLSNDACRAYLDRNNCLNAYTYQRADIRYDPKMNRAVFVVRVNGKAVDAAGRSLNKEVKPKWHRYGNSRVPFVCGDFRTGVIVEDCASACAVSSVASGIALLGTQLRDNFVRYLKGYNRLIVALDPDATAKAIDLARQLAYVTKTEVKRIPDDLKYMKPEELRSLLALD